MAKTPILDLDSLIERPTIRIDGDEFELYSPEEISLLDSQWYTRRGQEIEAAAKEDRLKDLERLIDEVCRRCIVEIPDEVFTKLKPTHKTRIVEAFTALLLQRRLSVAGAIAAAVVKSPISTGEIFSQGSSASSGATPTGGSEEPRPH